MLAFIGQLNLINFDEKAYKKSLKEALDTQLRQAARAWLRAVIPAVPVYTGTARGSLQPLGRLLKVAVPIDPETSRSGKGPGIGAAKSHFEFSSKGGIYSFDWSTDVLHYWINEYNDMSGILPLTHPTPWHSLEKGEAAFNAYLAENLAKRIPNMGDFIKYDAVQVR